MNIKVKGKSYEVDEKGFLIDFNQWSEDFAEFMAAELGIKTGLSSKHWDVIRFIRDRFFEEGRCPLVYETCRANVLTWRELRTLFPSGYLRGACLIAGITYKYRSLDSYRELGFEAPVAKPKVKLEEKTYTVDTNGFLVNPAEWDEDYAVGKAMELRVPGGLTKGHWKVIHFIRESYEKTGIVPTVYECCESNGIELYELERLFPPGYQRGVIKISGLRIII